MRVVAQVRRDGPGRALQCAGAPATRSTGGLQASHRESCAQYQRGQAKTGQKAKGDICVSGLFEGEPFWGMLRQPRFEAFLALSALYHWLSSQCRGAECCSIAKKQHNLIILLFEYPIPFILTTLYGKNSSWAIS